VKVGVLGFDNGVRGVRDGVRSRRVEVARLLKERKGVAVEIALGREMLEVEGRVGDLESALSVGSEEEDGEVWDDDDDGGDGVNGGVLRLRRLVYSFVVARNQIQRLGGRDQPFMVTLDDRMSHVRKTLLIDLGTALKEAKRAGEDDRGKIVDVLVLYSVLEEGGEVVKILKETKS